MGRLHLLQSFLASILIAAQVSAQPVYNPGNGHNYELITTQMTWDGARMVAGGSIFAGWQGHLATITSADENAFLAATFASGEAQYFAWIGGYEPNDDGVWLWKGFGPENNGQFSQGGTATPPFNYVNWGGVEPNDFAPGEDFAAINLGALFAGVAPGGWIDSPNPNPSDPIRAFIVEYDTTPTSVGGETPGAALRVGPAAPNPFSTSTRIEYSHDGLETVRIEVFDVRGRLVTQRQRAGESSGAHSFVWDGRDDDGERLPAGVYICVVRTGNAREARKLLLID